MTRQEEYNRITKRITELERELTEVKGTPCEIYSRSVGYLRPTTQWNKGKVAEFRERVVFTRMGKEKV